MTFGIPIDDFPISSSGELKRDRHKEFLGMLRKRESQSITEQKPIISIPSRSDVLFGRGKPFQQHPGNVRLNVMVESLVADYDSKGQRLEKAALAEEVVVILKSIGTRFLHKVDGIWEEAGEYLTRDKVSNTFRSVRSTMQKERKIGFKLSEKKPKTVLSTPEEGAKKRFRQD
jgi:hypothetical protein